MSDVIKHRRADLVDAEIAKLRAVLKMGIQLCYSGGHGDGKNCPTCHFMREAQKALGLEPGWHASDEQIGRLDRLAKRPGGK